MDLEIIILSEVKDNYIASYMWNLFFLMIQMNFTKYK